MPHITPKNTYLVIEKNTEKQFYYVWFCFIETVKSNEIRFHMYTLYIMYILLSIDNITKHTRIIYFNKVTK